jgi:protein SCO1
MTSPPSAAPPQAASGFRPWRALAVLLFLAGLVALSVRLFGPGPALPVLGTLPEFELTAQDGQPFGSAQLKGKPFVANFIFTRCPTVCPPFTQKMASLQPDAREFRLVTFSVDPEFDTPEVLSAYARGFKADPRRWIFLTGDEAAVRRTVVDGLKVAVVREGASDDPAALVHGTHFVLVDRALRIRGYYSSLDLARVTQLRKDARALAREK